MLTNREFHLQTGNLAYKTGFSFTKRESWDTKGILGLLFTDFAIVTNVNERFLDELERKLHFKQDKRIKFVGTVYDQELLKKIRENAYAYFHGHTVGGTNPSLIEALGSTDLNLLVDVGFNKEVAQECALYWSRDLNCLAKLIHQADNMTEDEIIMFGKKAKKRVAEEYTWEKICKMYENVFGGTN